VPNLDLRFYPSKTTSADVDNYIRLLVFGDRDISSKLVDDFIFQKQQSANEKKNSKRKISKKSISKQQSAISKFFNIYFPKPNPLLFSSGTPDELFQDGILVHRSNNFCYEAAPTHISYICSSLHCSPFQNSTTIR
jgi:hypothetical protein